MPVMFWACLNQINNLFHFGIDQLLAQSAVTFLTTRDLWYWEKSGGMDGCKVGSDGVGNNDDDGVGKSCAEDSGENGAKSIVKMNWLILHWFGGFAF